jgi:hypothetical protein
MTVKQRRAAEAEKPNRIRAKSKQSTMMILCGRPCLYSTRTPDYNPKLTNL